MYYIGRYGQPKYVWKLMNIKGFLRLYRNTPLHPSQEGSSYSPFGKGGEGDLRTQA